MEPHRQLQDDAVKLDGEAHRALLDGDPVAASAAFARAAEAYRASWEVAPPRSYGRLVGRMKASILAGDGGRERMAAEEILHALGDDPDSAGSPAAGWAAALAALSTQDDARAREAADVMRGGPPPFARAAAAVRALADTDREALEVALDAIVADFATREDHLTGVAIADTAVVLGRLAAVRGLPGPSPSALLPNDT